MQVRSVCRFRFAYVYYVNRMFAKVQANLQTKWHTAAKVYIARVLKTGTYSTVLCKQMFA